MQVPGMVTELEAANNLMAHIMGKLRAAGYDVGDPIDVPDAIDDLIDRANSTSADK